MDARQGEEQVTKPGKDLRGFDSKSERINVLGKYRSEHAADSSREAGPSSGSRASPPEDGALLKEGQPPAEEDPDRLRMKKGSNKIRPVEPKPLPSSSKVDHAAAKS